MYIKVKVPRDKVPSIEAVGFKLYLLKSSFYNSLQESLAHFRIEPILCNDNKVYL